MTDTQWNIDSQEELQFNLDTESQYTYPLIYRLLIYDIHCMELCTFMSVFHLPLLTFHSAFLYLYSFNLY
jgi:hypothetical protein